MSDARILRANERYKAASAAFFQLGTALTAAVAVKIYVEKSFGFESAAWLLIAAGLIWTGWLLLGLLEPEFSDDIDPV